MITDGRLTISRIYVVRTSLSKYYDYRISSTDAYIKSLTKERDTTIERLKEATKYNSTQQLLEKYGNSPKPKGPPSPGSRGKPQGAPKQAQNSGQRTGLAPPPTANIQRPSTPQPSTPQGTRQLPSPTESSPLPDVPGAEFAPNAFTPAELKRQYSSAAAPTLMDRLMNALLGEDETQPKNRLALICSECRLVNGLAPPGARTLEDVGRWRCSGCRAWNGKEKVEEDTISQLVQGWEEERRGEMMGKRKEEVTAIATEDHSSEDDSSPMLTESH